MGIINISKPTKHESKNLRWKHFTHRFESSNVVKLLKKKSTCEKQKKVFTFCDVRNFFFEDSANMENGNGAQKTF